MKHSTTQRYIRSTYDVIFSVPYCNAQNLLSYIEPFAYHHGVYGWNCDYYYIDGVCICTGYRPHGTHTAHGITAKYEKEAEKLRADWDRDFDTKMQLFAELRSRWIAEMRAAAAV